MTGRIPFGFFTLLTALVCAPIQAQDQMGPPPAPGYGVQPAGFHAFQDGAGQYNPYPDSPYPGNYRMSPLPRTPGTAPRMVYEELPDDLGFTEGDTPLGNVLTNMFRHQWFRSEYLLWNISGPGSGILGEQTLSGVANNSTLSGGPATTGISQGTLFSRTVNGITGIGQTPGLGDFSISNLSGFRGTYGLPLPVGASVELSAFVLGSSSSQLDAGTTIPGSIIQTQIIANPAITPGSTVGSDGNPATNGQVAMFASQASLLNGVRSDSTFIDYDVSYHAKLTTSAWGSEGNIVLDSPDPNSPFQIRPTFGFRYFNLRDKLEQSGQYNQASVLDPTVNTVVTRQINSSANNNLYGPQIGLRAEVTYSQFLIGFEPKVMMALNTWQSSLDNVNVFSSTDPGQSLVQRGTTFSPLVDLRGYGSYSINKYLSAYVSYNFIWTGSVNRSYNDIVYNKSSQTGNADFSLQKVYSSATIQGMSFGFELKY